jgi:hypothetical protein
MDTKSTQNHAGLSVKLEESLCEASVTLMPNSVYQHGAFSARAQCRVDTSPGENHKVSREMSASWDSEPSWHHIIQGIVGANPLAKFPSYHVEQWNRRPLSLLRNRRPTFLSGYRLGPFPPKQCLERTVILSSKKKKKQDARFMTKIPDLPR